MAELAVVTQEIVDSIDTSSWPKERKLLWQLVRENGSKISDLGTEIGFSRSQVSQYINDNNFNPSEKFVQAVRFYLQKIGIWDLETKEPKSVSGYINNINQLEMILTEGWKRTWYVLDTTYQKNNFGMVVGPSGCGKTSAIECWRDRPENIDKSIFITANGCMSRKAILKRIAREIGILANSDSDTLVVRICAELKERPKLIIIDEADQLSSEWKLEILRTLI
ncbi:MAG: AAA family ATPase, partial [Sporomusaceae bacterium]|nr:AAA family ATPase [Sporomusaceae bacterium]